MVKLEEVTNEKYFPRGGGSDRPKPTKEGFPTKGLKRKSAVPEQNDAKKAKEESSWIPKVDDFIDGLTGLGVVAELFDDGVLLHTAGTHTVKIHAAEVSANFTDLFNENKIEIKDAFQIGQMVPFRVISKKSGNDKGRSKASCNPARLNKHLSPNMLVAGLVIHTAVTSLEEKGAILDVGLDQMTGFIEKSQFPAAGLREGQPLVVRVLSTTSRVVKVTSFVEQDNLNMSSCEKLQLNHLMPGTILECEPTGDAVTAGVIVNIGNGLKGILPRRNLPPRLRENPEKLGKAIRAVVMFCQQNSKVLVLNAHPDIVAVSRVEKRTSFEGIQIGDKVQCTVVDVIPTKSIVYFTLPPTDGKKSLVTAVSSRGLLEKPDSVATEYEVGTEKFCRVTGFRYADRAITVSTRKDILNQKITKYQDAKCGDVLDARVHHVAKNGVYFSVCNFVQAFAPMSLLSDKSLNLQKLKAKFQVGTETKCRVWQICDQRKNLIVTCREQIIALKGPSANSVEELEIGNTLPCIVKKVFDSGVVLLATFNNICGVLRKEAAIHLPATPKVNDFVVANVEKVEDNNRVVFVLRDANPNAASQNSQKKLAQRAKPADGGVNIGKVYKGSLTAKKGEKANVTFTGENKKEVFASVDDHLLSDLLDAPIGLTKRLLAENKEEVSRIVPMGKIAAVNRACVKRSVARFVKGMKLPKKIEDLKEGQVVVGVVGQIITNLGVFVEVVGGAGLIGKVFERKNAKSSSELLEVGQVVIGKIESVDVAKKSFLIDPCTEMDNGEHMLEQYALPLLESIVEEVKWLAEHSTYPAPGSKVNARVTKELDDLTLVEFEHNGKKIAGVVPKKAGDDSSSEKETPKKKKNATKTLIVVDINHSTNEVVLAALATDDAKIVAILSDEKVKLHMVVDAKEPKLVSEGVYIATRGGGDVDDVARTNLIKKEFIGSAKPAENKREDGGEQGKKSIKNFGIYTGIVLGQTKFEENRKKNSLFVDIRLPGDNIGHLHVSEFPPNLLNAKNPLEEFLERNKNKQVVVRIIGFEKGSQGSKIAQLTMIPSKIQAGKVRASVLSFPSNYKVGDIIKCFASATLTDKQNLKVEVNPLWSGSISRENVSEDLKATSADGGIVDLSLSKGEMRQAKVIAVERKRMSLDLNLNISDVETEFKIGTAATGRVIYVSKTYIRLKLSSGQQAVLTPTATTDKYESVEEIAEKQLAMGQLVDVVGLKVEGSPLRYYVAMKSRFNSKSSDPKRQLLTDATAIKEGTQLDGIVGNASKGSLFIELGPGIVGRIPVNEENQDILEIGTSSVVRVTAAKVAKNEIVLKLDDILIRKWTKKPERKRHASKSEGTPSKVALLEEEKTSETVETEDPGFDWSNKGFRNEDLAAVGKLTSNAEDDSDEDDEDEETEEVSDEEDASDAEEDVDDEEEDVDDEEDSEDDEEKKVELIEKSEEEHSRLVRSDPNSAINWIEYMSLFVEKSDLKAARKTAEEALSAINPTESEELLKMWTAYLNMEVAYGDSTTVDEVFKRACKNANSYTIYRTLAKIYQKFNKHAEAKHILEQMVSKFRANKLEVWTLLAEHLMNQKEQKGARDLLPRALKSAPKAQQRECGVSGLQRFETWILSDIQLISKFAQLEFKLGDAERGRTLLEGLVTAHPKKTDLWLVYADAALKHLGIEHARKILERACNRELSVHKMRPLYKKWLEMESKHGDAASIQLVKSKAESFLQSVADDVMEEED
ncbi:Protein CBG09112 [Caenorhabditis briggsae]|uniref:rRNA biogenesis protein RRP5 n=1 Tax=Caenorhabditis briggsae TaxID=6238 RepID=A8X7S0_CAEBR|nr:Protein CBG09112 [Caenorhabditis briggsae]CAP28681.2 Protein CBG09112 [Caenorhabditis briggsae]